MKAKRYFAGSLALTAFLTLIFTGWCNFNRYGALLHAAAAEQPNHKEAEARARQRLNAAYGQLPLRFEANAGQFDARVRFVARGGGYALLLTADQVILKLRAPHADAPTPTTVIGMRLVGANPRPHIKADGEVRGKANYLIGNDARAWRRDVANFSRVRYHNVYPGIDLFWYGRQQQLEHDFIIAPGADPARIKLSFSGAERITIEQQGALQLTVDGGALRLLPPQAWQDVDGVRRQVACRFQLDRQRRVTFRLGAYDARWPLVIDPVLVYSTYIGGASVDQALGVAVDAAGNAYLTGQTDSTDFPGTSPLQASKGAQTDAFILKLNAAGDAVVYATWLGGAANDVGNKIAVDAGGNVYVAGVTFSADFPTKEALQPIKRGARDGFVAKLNAQGDALLYATYLGGTGNDAANAIAVDAQGNAYVAGSSEAWDFPTSGGFQSGKRGSAVYATSDAGGNWRAAGTGLTVAQVNDIAVDPNNAALLYAGTEQGVFKSVDGGATWAQSGGGDLSNFTITQVVVDPLAPNHLYAVGNGAFFKSADSGNTWSRLTNINGAQVIAISPTAPAATIYAAASGGAAFRSTDGGATWTPFILPPFTSTFPLVYSFAADPSAPNIVYAGSTRVVYKTTDSGNTWTPLFNFTGLPSGFNFVVNRLVVSPSATQTLYAVINNGAIYKTIDGGSNWTAATTPVARTALTALAVATDDPATVYAGVLDLGVYKSTDGGQSWSAANNGLFSGQVRVLTTLPAAPATILAGTNSGEDAFIAKLNASGNRLIYSSYLGGGNNDFAQAVAVDAAGNAYLAGATYSPDLNTRAAYQTAPKSLLDAFVSKINADGATLAWSTFLGGNGADVAYGVAVGGSGQVVVAGVTASTDFPVLNALQANNRSVAPATTDAFITGLSNDGARLDFSTYLGGSGAERANGVALDAAGNVYAAGETDSEDFPLVSPVQTLRGGFPNFSNFDAFAAKLAGDGARLEYATYLGGDGTDRALAIAVDGAGNAYLTGIAGAPGFPLTPNPLRTGGFGDSFITKLGINADVAVTMTDLPDPVQTNNQLTYLITVVNNGPDAAGGVTIVDTLPAGTNFISATASQGNCNHAAGTVNCQLGELAVSAAASISIAVRTTTNGTLVNRVNVTSATPDNNAANNTAVEESRAGSGVSIYGRVTLPDGTGLSGVTVTLSGGAARPPVVTNSDGSYQFADLPFGGVAMHTVTPSRPGYVFQPAMRTFSYLNGDSRGDFTARVCVFTLTQNGQSFPATGGAGSVTINASDAQCPWTAGSDVDWIKITSASSGNGAITFNVAPTVGARSGTLRIAGQIFTVWQEFNPCDKLEFSAPPLLPLIGAPRGDTPPQLIVADFNGDQRGDLLYSAAQTLGSQTPGDLLLALSKIDGSYQTPTAIFKGERRGATSADFNNDGKTDLAVAVADNASRTGGVVIMLGDGAGGFAAPRSFATAPSPTWLTTGDYNGDGQLDLAITTGPTTPPSNPPLPPVQYNVSLLPGDGAGNFGAALNVPITTGGGAYLLQIEAGDFNADGRTDFVAAGLFGPLGVLINNGAGGFNVTAATAPPRFGGALTTGDFNGDGRTDIAVLADGVYLLTADALGSFNAPVKLNVVAGKQITAGDFNVDGKTDLVVTSGDGIAVLYARGGALSAPDYYVVGTPFIANASVVVPLPIGDYDLDGRPDVLLPVRSNSEWSLAVVRATGAGFDAARRYLTHANTDSGGSTVAGDLNNDGALDLVTVFSSEGKIAIALSDGRGGFRPPLELRVDAGSNRAFIRDLNRDGRGDLIIHQERLARLSILLGDGQGGFTPKTKLEGNAYVYALLITDFNNDGHLDLIANNRQQGLTLFAGDGQGNFAPLATGIASNVLSPVYHAADFNGDGNVDLLVYNSAVVNCEPGRIAIYVLFGDGRGNFAAPMLTNLSQRISSLIVSDLNSDGRSDLLISNSCGLNPGLFVMLAADNNRFANPVRLDLPAPGELVTLQDLTGDGKQDLVLQSGQGLQILPGDGRGQFGQPFTVSNWRGGVTAINDQNGDGAPDILQFSALHFINVYLNRAPCLPAGGAVAASAASYHRYQLAPNSIAALFGTRLATEVQAATSLPLPTTLAGVSIKLIDSAGVERTAPLFFVSPTQINYLLPAEIAPGGAALTVLNGNEAVATTTIMIMPVEPGLFSANASGRGLAAATVLRVKPDGTQVFEPIAQFAAAQNRFNPLPIDVSDANEQVFLLLFGTGLRQRSSLAAVTATINDAPVEVLYAGAQGSFAGLDQINLRLLPSLAGQGLADIKLTIDGRAANTVNVSIR